MVKVSILCWQEIPSLVEGKDGTTAKKVELSQRFQELIDLIAMKRKLDGTDEYLMHWNKKPRPEVEGDLEEVVAAVAEEIEAEYERIKFQAIAES